MGSCHVLYMTESLFRSNIQPCEVSGYLLAPTTLWVLFISEKLIMALNGDCFELRGHGALTTSVHYLNQTRCILLT